MDTKKIKGRTFTLGDCHGGYRALVQVLLRSNFNKEEDTLICLGDVADGYPQVPECFEELLTIKNLVYVIGNHDVWLLNYLKYNVTPHIWTSQGGDHTLKSYEALKNVMDWKQIGRHTDLLQQAKDYHIQDNKIFVHGGFNWRVPINEQFREYITWNRAMFKIALEWHHKKEGLKFPIYDEIYIGHSTTTMAPYLNKHYERDTKPLFLTNLINVDTGGGFEGKLTIMDIDSKEYWQSDKVSDLYPDHKHR